MMPIVIPLAATMLLAGICLTQTGAHPTILGHSWKNTSLGYRDPARNRKERSLVFFEQIISTESSNEMESSNFGWNLDISGTVLVVGSGNIGGFVYEKEGSAWVFSGRLYHTLPEWWYYPSTNGFVIVVFARDSASLTSEKILIFERQTGSWNLVRTLWPNEDQVCASDVCGVLVIGATLSTSVIFITDTPSSTIQLYRKNGDIWVKGQTLSEPGKVSATTAYGAYLVSAQASTAINGKPNAGAGVLFKLNGDDYEKLNFFQSPYVSESESFGQSLSLNDEWLAVGATQKVYMFKRNGDDFLFSQQLSSPTGCNGDYCEFAWTVKLSGDLMAVSKPFEPSNDILNVGVAYVYAISSGSWVLMETLRPSSPQANEQYSYALDFGWDVIVVGAPQRDGGKGAVYLESFARTPVPTPTETPTARPTASLSISPSPSHTPVPNPVTLSPSPSRAPVTENPTSSQAPVTASPSPSHFVVSFTPTPSSSVVPTEPSESQTETPGDDKSSFPIGAVVGGVVGGLLLVGAVVGGVIYYKKKHSAPPVVPDPDDVHYQGIETGESRTHPIGDDPNLQLDD